MSSRAERRSPVALGIVVLVVMIAAAGFGLSRLSVGTSAASHRTGRSPGTTTSTTAQIVTSSTTAAQPVMYQVRAGDSLSGIARRFGVSTAAILFMNRLADPNHLTVGQTLTIPPPLPIRLAAKPAKPRVGETIELRLSGAVPGEQVSFLITSPTGSYAGPPHVAEPDGNVTAVYTPAGSGTYTVAALGDQGTVSRIDVVVGATR